MRVLIFLVSSFVWVFPPQILAAQTETSVSGVEAQALLIQTLYSCDVDFDETVVMREISKEFAKGPNQIVAFARAMLEFSDLRSELPLKSHQLKCKVFTEHFSLSVAE